MSLCQSPPKLTRSCSSLTTGVISGNPSIPLMNGYSMTLPKRLAKAGNRSGGRFWPRKKNHEVFEPGLPDRSDRPAVEVSGKIDPGDLGAQRAGDRTDLKRTVGHEPMIF